MKVGCPLGFLDYPRGVANQVDINGLLTIGKWAGQVLD